MWGPKAVLCIASQELQHRKACFKELHDIRKFCVMLHYTSCLLSFAVFNRYMFVYFQDLVSSGQENGIPFEPINKADDVDPIRNSDQQEVDRDATKAHEDTNRLNERDACPNTYLPEGSDQEKMHVEIDPKTTEPTGSFCGCNENEFLEALPT